MRCEIPGFESHFKFTLNNTNSVAYHPSKQENTDIKLLFRESSDNMILDIPDLFHKF